ncbi:glycosyltransferase family 4 protein [Amphiplicatus metriothermophilus]|uniref:Glycosyl transferases group 1 n=1 Tax=Amphiplicatus metriothermophilus TaxID=1519374 RepID=A0A239PL00_9PROT|nr:glycosyltransferase family 4 protein [Amphiplicatus metriothermophilus]MBB5517357.1 glycosyltransferase involved in cell wall biosynthesis [Amphiplicatus metriothermophilus]SNT68307.1 Glycosyl transferases group 1 [Amphiplicatus metriothermophilus]
MKILIVAANISRRMGGEAVLPWHYIRELSALGHEAHGLTHARVRDELKESEIWRADRLHFVEDSFLERSIYQASRLAPGSIREAGFYALLGAVTMARLAGPTRRLAAEIGADVIHQPTPVSPHFPSFLTNMPAPTVIGPLNGGMAFPKAFAARYAKGADALAGLGRALSAGANALFPGKRQAARILVANARTARSLPAAVRAERVERLVDNGVDLGLWNTPGEPPREAPNGGAAHFVFVGRLIALKGVDLLIDALERLDAPVRLTIVGDGPERARLEARAAKSPARDRIRFAGFRPQPEIRDILATATALVLPSLRECGGAAILEAFACRRPAIATDWGGPQDYVTPETGVLVAPESREGFVAGLAAAMRRLAEHPEEARRMGEAARARVEAHFAWRAKAARIVEIYEEAARLRA